jgi:hypothetical protein
LGSDLEQLRGELDELGRQLHDVQWRLARLESREAAAQAVSERARPEAPTRAEGPGTAEPPAVPGRAAGTIALVGRSLVVLGGAFLFRALSDRGLVPPLAGAGAALLYAAWWLVCCSRSAAAGRRASALFHGVTGTLIAYPLIWETTARFGIVAASEAAIAAVAFLAVTLSVASRNKLPALAWTSVVVHVGACLALILGTHSFLPLSAALLAAGALVESLVAGGGRLERLRWPAALGADAAVLMTITVGVHRATTPTSDPALASAGVIAVALCLPVLYLASIGQRSLLRGRPLSGFDVSQAAVALLVGFAGAVRMLLAGEASVTPVGVLALLLGAGCYAAAFACIDRRRGRGPDLYGYTTFAGLLTLAGSALLLPGGSAPLAGAWCALAAIATGVGVHFDRITLRFHGVAYLVAAAVPSGLLAASAGGMLTAPAGWHSLDPAALVVLALAMLCGVALLAVRRPDAAWYTHLPHVFLAALLVGSLAGLAVRTLASFAMDAGGGDGAALLAAARSVAIALAAIALAWAGRRAALPELQWLVYPVLVAGAAKLLWEDFRLGDPVALFAALAAYGGALIATPRLMRRE